MTEDQQEQDCRERADSCVHRWSHNPKHPERARPRPFCLDCGINIDNHLSQWWLLGVRGGTPGTVRVN